LGVVNGRHIYPLPSQIVFGMEKLPVLAREAVAYSVVATPLIPCAESADVRRNTRSIPVNFVLSDASSSSSIHHHYDHHENSRG